MASGYGRVALLLAVMCIAIVVLRYVILLVAGIDLMKFDTPTSRVIGGAVALYAMWTIYNMVIGGRVTRLGHMARVGDPSTFRKLAELERVQQRRAANALPVATLPVQR